MVSKIELLAMVARNVNDQALKQGIGPYSEVSGDGAQVKDKDGTQKTLGQLKADDPPTDESTPESNEDYTFTNEEVEGLIHDTEGTIDSYRETVSGENKDKAWGAFGADTLPNSIVPVVSSDPRSKSNGYRQDKAKLRLKTTLAVLAKGVECGFSIGTAVGSGGLAGASAVNKCINFGAMAIKFIIHEVKGAVHVMPEPPLFENELDWTAKYVTEVQSKLGQTATPNLHNSSEPDFRHYAGFLL